METRDLQFHLEQLAFTAGLPAGVLEELAKAAELQTLAASAVLFREGGANHRLYLVREGRLALEVLIPGRAPSRILTIGPGEMCGWSSLLGEGRMTASAIATEDTLLIAFAVEKLRELCEANAEFGFHLMRQMALALSSRLVATRLQMLDLFGNVPQVTSESTEP